jgi:hypothetical protein
VRWHAHQCLSDVQEQGYITDPRWGACPYLRVTCWLHGASRCKSSQSGLLSSIWRLKMGSHICPLTLQGLSRPDLGEPADWMFFWTSEGSFGPRFFSHSWYWLFESLFFVIVSRGFSVFLISSNNHLLLSFTFSNCYTFNCLHVVLIFPWFVFNWFFIISFHRVDYWFNFFKKKHLVL